MGCGLILHVNVFDGGKWSTQELKNLGGHVHLPELLLNKVSLSSATKIEYQFYVPMKLNYPSIISATPFGTVAISKMQSTYRPSTEVMETISDNLIMHNATDRSSGHSVVG